MIKNLLFDLGGVIIDLQRHCCIEAYRRLGMDHPEAMLDEYTQKGPFLKVENGEMTAPEFRDELRRYISREVTDKEIDDAFCEFLKGLPVSRLRALEKLRKHYDIYLLSNTNPIMWHSRIKELFEQDGREREDYFDGIVTSFEAHAVKPDPAVFKLVVDKLGIEPGETLFLDDSRTNLDAASDLGFKTALVEPGQEFINLIPPQERWK